MSKSNRINTGDGFSIVERSFTPKAIPISTKIDTTTLDVNGNARPKAVPTETKDTAPPAKNN